MATTTPVAPLEITDVTDADRAAALAAVIPHEAAATLARVRDSVIHTAREIRELTWLLARVQVEVTHETVEITGVPVQQARVTVTGPAGRTAARHAHTLYAVLERAANTLDNTPYALPFWTTLEGHSHPYGGSLTWC